MKKRLLQVVTTGLALSCMLSASAAQAPFEPGTLGCQQWRIPVLYTLNDGSVLAAADLRWNHGTDAPENLDTAVARSTAGYAPWSVQVVNRFDDVADGVSDKNSAAFIDASLTQDSSGRLYLLTDAFPSGVGYPNAKTGSGCDSSGALCLAARGSETYAYTLGTFQNGHAPVLHAGAPTAYTVDTDFCLEKDGAALTLENGAKQSVFYAASDFHVFPTSFLWLRTSDDNGQTWSAPQLLNGFVKHDDEAFLGVCPGRGMCRTVNGKTRVMIPLYCNPRGKEHALVIWSEDGGATWQRGAAVQSAFPLQKSSEAQMIVLPDGTLRMFCRNQSHYISFCDSGDGGATWTKAVMDSALRGTKNCMVSAINTTRTISGRPVVLLSMAGSTKGRADGIVRVGVIDAENRIDWRSTYHVNDGFFAYSCLTELPDGNFGLLFEDEAAHLSYKVLTLSAEGTLRDADGNDAAFEKTPGFFEKAAVFFWNLYFRLRGWM